MWANASALSWGTPLGQECEAGAVIPGEMPNWGQVWLCSQAERMLEAFCPSSIRDLAENESGDEEGLCHRLSCSG